MVGAATAGSRKGQEPAATNGAATAGPSAVGSDPPFAGGEVLEFSSREDVDRLLNEKMKGKNKTDYKVEILLFSTKNLIGLWLSTLSLIRLPSRGRPSR